jgi:hypothetical protein
VDAMIEKFVFQVIPILREYVKDGILDSFEDLIQNEHSIDAIKSATGDERIEMLGENIMMFIKHFGEPNALGKTIDNEYIADFIEALCNALGY